MRPRGGATLCLAALLLPPALPLTIAHAASFTIEDVLSAEQVDEEISVYIDGNAVGIFRLTADHPADLIQVTTPDAPRYDYALCGKTTLRRADGSEEIRPVNDSGTLTDPNGRLYLAFTQGYVTFFLVDASLGRPPAEIHTHQGARCPSPIARHGTQAPFG